jgi:hypothetical protein
MNLLPNSPGMHREIMDEVQLGFWIIAAISAIVTAAIGISTFRKSIGERKLDLKWKQADAAKQFILEIHTNPFSGAAISMLDWFVIDKPDNFDKSKFTEIKYEDVLGAIPKISSRTYNEKERYILDCFDWFFYYVDRTEQHIIDGLFLFDNVKYIFYPYFKKISSHQDLYEIFMKERCYLLAPNFWNRFKADPLFKN